MPRPIANQTLEQIIQAAAAEVAASASSAIAHAVARIASQEFEKSLAREITGKSPAPRQSRVSRSQPRVAVTRWLTDKRARRVPNFVIEATGLKTKKAIVAKYGDNATFEKGKGLPKSKGA